MTARGLTPRRTDMTALKAPKKVPSDPVDRAVASARLAVGRLIRLLCDEDRTTVEKAAGALAEVGPFAVGPLAAALPRAESARDRVVIIGALRNLGLQAKAPALRALNAALKREQDPHVQMAVRMA